MLFAIDIGNTNLALGVFEGEKLVCSWRVATRRDQTEDEYAVLCRSLFRLHDLHWGDVKAIAISSVVPPLNDVFQKLSEIYFQVEPVFLHPEKQELLEIRYHPVSAVGADRIVNAIAVSKLHSLPAVVVDFGTATTFDAISKQGEYLGGVIAPGIGISAEALFARAAKLPRVDIRRPPQVIGQATTESIQSGLFYGYVGLVEGILERMREELEGPSVVATGGWAGLLAKECPSLEVVEPDLTLQGLRLFYEMTKSPGRS